MCTIKVPVHLVACNVWELNHEGVFAAGHVSHVTFLRGQQGNYCA